MIGVEPVMSFHRALPGLLPKQGRFLFITCQGYNAMRNFVCTVRRYKQTCFLVPDKAGCSAHIAGYHGHAQHLRFANTIRAIIDVRRVNENVRRLKQPDQILFRKHAEETHVTIIEP